MGNDRARPTHSVARCAIDRHRRLPVFHGESAEPPGAVQSRPRSAQEALYAVSYQDQCAAFGIEATSFKRIAPAFSLMLHACFTLPERPYRFPETVRTCAS